MRRLPLSLLAAASLAAWGPGGCRPQDPSPAPEPAVSTLVHAGAAELALSADAARMRTVDRLRVTVRATGDRGARLGQIAFDPAGAGWTVIARADQPLTLTDDGRTTRVSTFTLEPFLEGEYQLPPATVTWRRADEEGTVATQALVVAVDPVLPAGEAPAIGAARPALPLPDPAPRAAWVPWAIAGAAAAGCAIVIAAAVASRRRAPRPEPSPIDRLRALDADKAAPQETIDRVAAALGDRVPPELEPVRAACERVRFGGASPTRDFAVGARRRTLEVLGGRP